MKRYGWVIGVQRGKIDNYKKLHASVWPDVLKILKMCHIQNYSIYLREIIPGQFFLFSYLEYTGSDFEADMAKMAADEIALKWWRHTDPCQRPIDTAEPGQKWVEMEEVFHLD